MKDTEKTIERRNAEMWKWVEESIEKEMLKEFELALPFSGAKAHKEKRWNWN